MPNRSKRRCSVYDADGECCSQTLDLEARPEAHPARFASRVPLHEIMTSDVVCARAKLSATAVVDLMIQHHIGCLPIIDDERRPIGMITKFDIVEQLHAVMKSVASGSYMPTELAARTANDLMMPLAMTLRENATVGHAAALMAAEGMHHIPVTNERGRLVGVVSTQDITRWVSDHAKEETS